MRSATMLMRSIFWNRMIPGGVNCLWTLGRPPGWQAKSRKHQKPMEVAVRNVAAMQHG